jgi:hypothetical protein
MAHLKCLARETRLHSTESRAGRRRGIDPRSDRQGRLSALVQQSAAAQEATGLTFARIRAAVREATGEAGGTEPVAIPMGSTEGRPRLTEPWFC